VRAGLSRTFGGLIGFAALLFLSLGTYLLYDAFAHPVDAQAAALIVAASAIAVGGLLLFYLFKPLKIAGMTARHSLEDSCQQKTDASSPAGSILIEQASPHKDLPYQHAYGDRSLIRP
jgi:hypothetical protein